VAINAKRAAFVREYLIDLNATQAAIRAGYSPKTARQQGARLLSDVDIQAAVQKAQAELSQIALVTAEDVVKGLREIATGTGPEGARVAAWAHLGKYLGMFTERQEVTMKSDIIVDLRVLPDAASPQ
jgi:phage terminase small subunit